jgi:peptidoglycan/xylan/chitin deacetylase (PgdA/CDA1 family)
MKIGTAFLLLVTYASWGLAQTDADEPSWKWTEEEWRSAVERVRAGESLLPAEWPEGARVAVALSFDFDNETPSLRDNQTSPSLMSNGQYGSRRGLPRVLDLLRRYDVPSSFFIPAVSALLYPDDVRRIVEAGHEVGVHGWIHERNSMLAREDEKRLLEKAAETLTRLTGKRPAGIRTPSWDYSPNTLDIIEEMGFLYDSSLMADDGPYELLSAGRATGIVELPVEWILDDAPYFNMSRFGNLRPHTTPDEVYTIWKAEFDVAYEEGGLFLLTTHPHIVGHRSRIAMLERLVQHMRQRPGVWFATHEQVARYVKERKRSASEN